VGQGRRDEQPRYRGSALKPGWDALAAGFLAATPLMNTSLYVGYVSAQ
jgi:hypothetical protein